MIPQQHEHSLVVPHEFSAIMGTTTTHSGLIWFEGSGCDCLLMRAASLFDGFSFDLVPPFENGL
jgi:hypothetical protein